MSVKAYSFWSAGGADLSGERRRLASPDSCPCIVVRDSRTAVDQRSAQAPRRSVAPDECG